VQLSVSVIFPPKPPNFRHFHHHRRGRGSRRVSETWPT
jgi:hypothetical protein